MPLDDPKEKFVQVDLADKVIGPVDREVAHSDRSIIHRAVCVMVVDRKGNALFQKRSKKKDLYPGYWALGCAGHVTYGDTYEEAASRELDEELGISGRIQIVDKFLFKEVDESEFVCVYKLVRDTMPQDIDKDEIDELKWVKIEDLNKFMSSNKITPIDLSLIKRIGLGKRMNLFENKRVLVTGGSRGIGRSTVLLASKMGAKVGINFTQSKAQVRLLIESLEKRGGDAKLIAGDVSDETDAKSIVDEMVERWGGIDILINNAGVISWKSMLDEKLDTLKRIVDVNLLGVINMTYFASKVMKKQENGGVIVNVSSGAGKTAYPNLAVYSATKFGVLGFTQAIAQELYEDNIRVYAVCPGMTATDMTDGQGMHPDKVAKRIIDTAVERLELHVGEDTEIYL